MAPVPFAAQNLTGIVLVSLVVLVAGYGLVGGLWYLMVYRPARAGGREGARESEQAGRQTDDDRGL